jgi:Peptidase family M23
MRVLTDVPTPPLRPTGFDLALRHLLAHERARGVEPSAVMPVAEATGIPRLFPLRVVADGATRTCVVNRRLDDAFIVSEPREDFAVPGDPAVVARVDELLGADVVPLIARDASATDAGTRWLVDHFYAFAVRGVAYLAYATFERDLTRIGMTFGPGFGEIERRLAAAPLVLDTAPALGRYVVYGGGDTIVTNPHFVSREMRYAVDLVPLDDGSRTVIAPAGGVVTAAADGHADDLPRDAPARNAEPLGNHVRIRSGDHDLCFAHLARGSVAVRAGQRVRAGDVLGDIGDSGHSAEPHLHFHVSTAGGVPHGVPLRFLAAGRPWEPRRGAVLAQETVRD